MSLSLTKGQKVSYEALKSENGNKALGKVSFVLNWTTQNNQKGDVDLSAVMLGADGMMWAKNSLVYYNNLVSEDGALRHSGDVTDGVAGEKIQIDLPRVDARTKSIAAVVSTKALSASIKDPLFLSNLASATLKLVAHEGDRKNVLCAYDLTDELGKNTSAFVGKLFRDGTGWSFEPVGELISEGFSLNGLVDLLKKFSLWFRRGDLSGISLDKLVAGAAAVIGGVTTKPRSTEQKVSSSTYAPVAKKKNWWWLLLIPLIALLWWALAGRSCNKPEVVPADTLEVVTDAAVDDIEVVTDSLAITNPATRKLFNDLMLHSIHFATNMDNLDAAEKEFLGRVAKGLKDNPDIKILVRGHTDNVDTDAVNIPLSLDRATMVRDYLVKNGTDINRLQVKGYGSSKPVDTNATETGRAKNRRVDFAIIK